MRTSHDWRPEHLDLVGPGKAGRFEDVIRLVL